MTIYSVNPEVNPNLLSCATLDCVAKPVQQRLIFSRYIRYLSAW